MPPNAYAERSHACEESVSTIPAAGYRHRIARLRFARLRRGAAAERVGRLISVHVIPRPHGDIDPIIPKGPEAEPPRSKEKPRESKKPKRKATVRKKKAGS